MSEQRKHNLNINLKKIHSLKQFNLDFSRKMFEIFIDFGKIHQIKHLDSSVLCIEFEFGDFRLDIDIKDLKKIKGEYLP